MSSERTRRARARGFSLVELLVVLAFTGLLMAGMATVFKSTLGSFMATGESLSGSRRNRLALDMVYDDLNLAACYLLDLGNYPNWINDTTPGFQITPGADADHPDTLTFAMDDALPFEAKLQVASTDGTEYGNNAVMQGLSLGSTFKPSFNLKLRTDVASRVVPGTFLVFKDNYDSVEVLSADATAGTDGNSDIAIVPSNRVADEAGNALGSSGDKPNKRHLDAAQVLVVVPRQMVRYSIVNRSYDPSDASALTPCLVREQVQVGKSFDPKEPSYSIVTVADNVVNFKVQLSVDSGLTWASGATWADICKAMEDKLATVGRDGYRSVRTNPHWFRDIPTLVRVDVTTQTAQARSEHSATGKVLERKRQTQSFIMMPKHAGLSYFN